MRTRRTALGRWLAHGTAWTAATAVALTGLTAAPAQAAGDEAKADALYEKLAPAVAFMMQGLPNFLTYGKLIAAERLGLEASHDRIPHETATPTGVAWAKRFAAALGPLPA